MQKVKAYPHSQAPLLWNEANELNNSPHLHNFSVHILERGSLGMRLKESDSHYMSSHYSAELHPRYK